MIEKAEYQQRMQRLQQQVSTSGLDAFVLRSDINIHYLTGVDYHSMERKVFLVVAAKGEPCLIVPRMEQTQLEKAATVDSIQVYWEMDAKPGRGWQATLSQTLDDAHNIGIEPSAEVEITASLQDRSWQICPLVENLRVIKSPAEIALTRRTAKYWNKAMQAMLYKAKAGVTVGELMAVAGTISPKIFSEEPQANWLNTRIIQFFQCAPLSGSPHHFSYRADDILPDGPSILNAVGALCNYNAENARTILTGGYTAQHAQLFDLVTQAHQMALDMIKPGVPCADVDCAIQDFFVKEGVGDYMQHRIGHGFGLEPHERPYSSEGSEEVYQPNMIISVEPGLYVKDVGGFRHSDTVLITEKGIENLTAGIPRDRGSLTF